mmetsp:Transcript_19722/g.48458  ORF Transcript_19722/g.48458 Transcript_19722/m.48458 type:complete len:186 (+) Transcript_19722:1519-2076(+)
MRLALANCWHCMSTVLQSKDFCGVSTVSTNTDWNWGNFWQNMSVSNWQLQEELGQPYKDSICQQVLFWKPILHMESNRRRASKVVLLKLKQYSCVFMKKAIYFLYVMGLDSSRKMIGNCIYINTTVLHPVLGRLAGGSDGGGGGGGGGLLVLPFFVRFKTSNWVRIFLKLSKSPPVFRGSIKSKI